eukprot:Anaeramoba_ignava/c21782_g1_i1.p1 GENE.c21782_g1_i1~~c21782_g1_i1.p1  ORF type:complete len:761 (+),score=318.55 c21782_g1_i1:125-2407(+)
MAYNLQKKPIKSSLRMRSKSIFKKPPKIELPRVELTQPQTAKTVKKYSRSISMLDVKKVNEKTSSVRQQIKGYLNTGKSHLEEIQGEKIEEVEMSPRQLTMDPKRLYGNLANKVQSPRFSSKQVRFAAENTSNDSNEKNSVDKQSPQSMQMQINQLKAELEEKENELRTVAELGLLVSKENKGLIAEIEDLQNQLLDHEEDDNMRFEWQNMIDELESEKAELVKKNQYLGKQIEEATTTNYSYLDQITIQEEEIESLKKNEKLVSKLKFENIELKNEIDSLQFLKSEIQKFSEEKQELKHQISKLELDKRSLLKSNEEKGDQLDILNVDYNSLKLEMDKLQSQDRKLNQSQSEIKQLKTQLDWMEKFTVSSTKLAETAQNIIELRLSEMENLDQEEKIMNEEAKKTISFLVHKLPLHLKSKNETDVSDENDEFEWMDLDLDDARQESEFIALYQDSKRKLVYLSYLLVFGKLYLDMESQKSLAEKEKNELNEEIQELKRKLEQEIEKNNNLEQILHKKLNESESGMNELQKENARKIQLLNDELNKSKENEKKLQKDLNASEENNRQLQNQIEELKQSLENQKQLTERQQNLNDSLKKQFEEKQKEMEEGFQKEKEEFENKIKNLLANIQKLEEEKKNLDNLINGKYQFEIDDYKFKIKQLGDKIQELNDVLKTQENKFKKEIEENNEKYEDEIKSLNKKLEQEKNSNEKLEEQIKFLKKQLEDEEKMRKKLEEQKKELETNLQIANARANAEYQEKKIT